MGDKKQEKNINLVYNIIKIANNPPFTDTILKELRQLLQAP